MQAAIFAAHAPVSRHIVFDLEGDDPERYLNDGIDWLRAGFTARAFWEDLPAGTIQGLSPLPSGWRRFGVVVSAPDDGPDETEPGVILRVGVNTLQAAIFQEWNPARAANARDALLLAQDAIRPQMLSIPPNFIVAMMALAKLAAHEADMSSNGMARWRANIALADRVLSPIVTDLMTAWLAGPSKAAARYRARARVRPPHQSPPGNPLFRTADWDGLLKAERPEPFLMRLLHEKSRALWRDDKLWAEARASWGDDTLAAVLGIARWDTAISGEC